MGAARSFDVAVVGGGPAGVAAACAAAASGARSVLVERSPRLGGNAANAFVHTICGLYHQVGSGSTQSRARLAQHGFARRFAEGLIARRGARAPERSGRVWVLATEPRAFAELCQSYCAELGVELLLASRLEGVALGEAGNPSRLELAAGDLESASSALDLEASVLVDATGDATVAALGGAEVHAEPAERLQRPSYIFRLRGVKSEALEGFARMRLTVAVAGAARAGELPEGCESVLVRPGISEGEAYVTLNLRSRPGEAYHPLDPECVRALDARGRLAARAIVPFLRTRPEFEAAEIASWPERIGIRETRRMVGRACVTREDVLKGARRADEVAVSAWPIELWNDHRRAELAYPEDVSSVPLTALVSASHPRLLAAGRCISADHDALGALRVIATSMATGEAAGVAAALACRYHREPASLDPADVRSQMMQAGRSRPSPAEPGTTRS